MLKSLGVYSQKEMMMLQANIETNPMEELARARMNMVQNQLVPNQIINHILLEAMSSVPRHLFVDERWSQVAYTDCALPVTNTRKLMEPLLFAKMVEACRIDKTSKVLNIGCGFGYSSIILSKLAESVIGE
jgi:protein-L-isoaspartate(D-aspartate) O-methyltransferase